MVGPVNFIVDLTPSKDKWTIKVRVIRLWKQPNFLQPELGDNVELVLLDENVLSKTIYVSIFYS